MTFSELSHQSDLGQQSVSLCEDDSILDNTMSVSLYNASQCTEPQNKQDWRLLRPPDSGGLATSSLSPAQSSKDNVFSENGSSAPSIEGKIGASNAEDFYLENDGNETEDVNSNNCDHISRCAKTTGIPEGEVDKSLTSENKTYDERKSRNQNNRLNKTQQEPELKAPLADPWKPITPHEAANTIPKPIRKGRTRRAPTRNVQLAGTKSRPKKQPSTIQEEKRLVPVEDFMIQQLSGGKYSMNGLRLGNKETAMAAELQDRADNVEKEKKRKIALENKRNNNLQKGDIENLQVMGNNQEEDNYSDDVDDGWDDAKFVANEDEFEDEPLPDPHEGGIAALVPDDIVKSVMLEENRTIGNNEERGVEEGVDSYEELVMKRVAAYVAQSQDYIESTDLAKRVAKWHDSIGPRLDAVERRGNFDIHQYGSEILEHFPEGRAKTTISFAELARGKEREEVARLFLSTLMLVNTYNVEIQNSSERPLVMDEVEMTLLSTRRHHESMFEKMDEENHSNPTTSTKRKGKQSKSRAKNDRFTSKVEDISAPLASPEKAYQKVQKSKGKKFKGKGKTKLTPINGLLHTINEESSSPPSNNTALISHNHFSDIDSVQPCSVNLDRLENFELPEGIQTSPGTHNSLSSAPQSLKKGVINNLDNPATFKLPLSGAGDLNRGKRRKIMR